MSREMTRAARRRQAKEDEKLLAGGLDPESSNPEPTAAMARMLCTMFEKAKLEKNINAPVIFLYAKAYATLRRLQDIPVACQKGCSHCCYTWVSASAPEILFIANIIRQRSGNLAARVAAAHLNTKDYDFDARGKHPHPCPLLEQDVCSIYELRPLTCRFAASANAEICARSYHNLSSENIPTPLTHLTGRNAYAVAIASALKRANLPYHAYEFNAGLARALEIGDAEGVWLAGEDIFSDVMRDPVDIFSQHPAHLMYQHAFG